MTHAGRIDDRLAQYHNGTLLASLSDQLLINLNQGEMKMFNAFQATTLNDSFGRNGKILRARQGESLSDELIMSRCPSVFADSKHDSRSDRFAYIPTIDMLAGMRSNGFLPVEVRQGGSKDVAKRAFTKHMLRFRKPGDKLVNVGDSVPELIMLNAHDGTSSYQLMAGWFRLVCLNGMVTADPKRGIDGIRITHSGNKVMDDVIEASYTVINDAQNQQAVIEDMRAIELSPGEQQAFAHSASALRFEDDHIDTTLVSRLNAPRRSEDNGNSLWLTFNRVQESLLRGGYRVRTTDEHNRQTSRRARPVNGIDQDLRLNKSLWLLAENMRQLKTAN